MSMSVKPNTAVSGIMVKDSAVRSGSFNSRIFARFSVHFSSQKKLKSHEEVEDLLSLKFERERNRDANSNTKSSLE